MSSCWARLNYCKNLPLSMSDRKCTDTNLCSDDHHLVRISAHEADESQKMQLAFRLRLKGKDSPQEIQKLRIYELVPLGNKYARTILQH